MPRSETSSGTLAPGQWKKVMSGWGKFSLNYQVFGTAMPLDVRIYTPLQSDSRLLFGGFFQFSPIGYGDVWFRSSTGGDYRIVPAEWR